MPAGPPFRTDDPEPVEFQHFEINMLSLGTKMTSGWSGILPGLEVNYGALPNLQLHAIVQQACTAPTGGRTGFVLGDVELGVKYRFITPGEDDWFPQVAVFPLIELPNQGQQRQFCAPSASGQQITLPNDGSGSWVCENVAASHREGFHTARVRDGHTAVWS